ncbi:MAG TPA: sialidase family protein [Candidatus Hydrogenedens sp.]|nr:sialidase family protein [Candidatus Hydrogenedens sp.]
MHRHIKLIEFIIVFLLTTFVFAQAEDSLLTVFQAGNDGYDTFRIPSLIKTPSGDMIAFCEGRKESLSDAGDIDLVFKRSEDNGVSWGHLQVLWDDSQNTCGNPCPVIDRTTGDIIMLMTWNRGDDSEDGIIDGTSKDTRRVFITRSRDDGITWAKPEEITTSVKHSDWNWYATGPGIGIQMLGDKYKNRLIIPCDHSDKNDKRMYSHVIYSDNGGKTWNYGKPVGADTDECQVVEIPDNRLLINMRNYNRDYNCRAISISEDGGINWGNVSYDLALIEPRCQASLIKHQLKNHEYLVFSNPANKGKRVNMTINISDDYGKTWKYQALVYNGPSAYSSLCSINNEEIGILFECGGKKPYEKIAFHKVNIKQLVKE